MPTHQVQRLAELKAKWDSVPRTHKDYTTEQFAGITRTVLKGGKQVKERFYFIDSVVGMIQLRWRRKGTYDTHYIVRWVGYSDDEYTVETFGNICHTDSYIKYSGGMVSAWGGNTNSILASPASMSGSDVLIGGISADLSPFLFKTPKNTVFLKINDIFAKRIGKSYCNEAGITGYKTLLSLHLMLFT